MPAQETPPPLKMAPAYPSYEGLDLPKWFRSSRLLKLPNPSLAPLRYDGVTGEAGPIAKLEYAESTYFGECWMMCTAWLKEEHLPASLRRNRVKGSMFSQADGSGLAKTRLEARSRAVSEALERWAFYGTSWGGDELRKHYGYTESDSTKGMAAYPGLMTRSARRLAMAEAHEGYCIDAWWDGQLCHYAFEREDSLVVFLEVPQHKGFVAIVAKHLELADFKAAYGAGSGETPADAERKARLEAGRTEKILQARQRIPRAKRPKSEALLEQRLVYFATPAGLEKFRERVAKTPWKKVKPPEVVCDCAVTGPWEQYTKVWRYALKPISKDWKREKFSF